MKVSSLQSQDSTRIKFHITIIVLTHCLGKSTPTLHIFEYQDRTIIGTIMTSSIISAIKKIALVVLVILYSAVSETCAFQISTRSFLSKTKIELAPFHLFANTSNDKHSKLGKLRVNKISFRHLHKRKAKHNIPPENLDGTVHVPLQKEINTVTELEEYFEDSNRHFRKKGKDQIDYDALLAALCVKGDTQIIGSKDRPDFVHPVLKVIHQRRKDEASSSSPFDRKDNKKVALVVEGGGMRGCVTAGMVTAIYYLGLENTFDVIYGSSAGTVIGAYFNTRQLPWFGPEVYYDSLTTAGKKFIDTKRLLRALGFGLMDPRLIKDVLTRPKFGRPVLNLDFLLRETMQEKKPLDWDKFIQMQRKQPLKVVASGLKRGKSVCFSMENGDFGNIQELAACMYGSCLLPGIAGPLMNHNSKLTSGEKDKFFVRNNVNQDGVEPLADALIYEPLPYGTAIEEGATDVVMLRSRPDGTDVTGKTSIFEKLIYHRFFRKKNKLNHVYKHMRQAQHKKNYARQVLELNEACQDDGSDTRSARVMAIAVPPGSPEVTRLESRRSAIFDGVRRGFARAYDSLVEDPNERGRGAIVAKQVLPDEILDYNPLSIDADGSAFAHFLKEQGSRYKHLSDTLGKTAIEAGMPR
jgi:predicted patatin/cPLA2 family phospholipase